MFSDIELEIAIKYEFFISHIKEILEQLSSSQKAALWSIAYDEEEYDIRSIEGVFPLEWTDFIFEDLYYDEVLIIEYLKKYIDPYKISAHSKKDLYYVFGKLSRK